MQLPTPEALSSSSDPREPFAPLLLSPIEDLFWSLGEQLSGARIAVVFRLGGCIEADLLATALLLLQRRHPKLRAVIVKQDRGRHCYHFDRAVAPIPFTITDSDDEELPWREETARLLHVGFAEGGPLAAVSVLRSRARRRSDLLVTVHHAIADGRSAIMLVHDLLTEYAAAETGAEAPARPVLPPVTVRRATSPGGWRSRWWMLRRIVRLQREDRRARQTRLPEVRDIPPQSQWMHWVLPAEDTLELVLRCRKERSSLGAALLAAVCCALVECLPAPAARFKCQFPFDLRDGLEGSAGPVTAADLGCFVSTMNEYYTVPGPSAFWDLARRAHQDVQAFVQQGGPALYYNLAGAMAARRVARSAGMRPPGNARVTLLVTSYGVLDMRDAYGSLRPRQCTLNFKSDVSGPSLIVEALVMGRQLNVGFAANSLDPGVWEALQVSVRRFLGNACRPAGADQLSSG